MHWTVTIYSTLQFLFLPTNLKNAMNTCSIDFFCSFFFKRQFKQCFVQEILGS